MSYLLPKNSPRWITIVRDYNDLAAAALTNTITIYTPADDEVVTGMGMYIPTAFSGGGISSYTLQVNWGAQGILVGVNALTPTVTSSGFNSTANAILGNRDAGGRVVTLDATSVSANLNAATVGQVEIYLLISFKLKI